MNRITGRNEQGVPYLPEWEGKAKADEVQAELLESVVTSLTAYEDTNKTPDEITAAIAELSALKADMDAGRLVRVVRCKDCQYGTLVECGAIDCEWTPGYMVVDGFCSSGIAAEQEGQDG